MINIVVMALELLVALETMAVMQAEPEAVMMIPTAVVDDHLDLHLVMDLVTLPVLVQLPVTPIRMVLVPVTDLVPGLVLVLAPPLGLVPVQLLLDQALAHRPVIQIPMAPALAIIPIQVRIITPLVFNAGHVDLQASMIAMQMEPPFNVL